jgi:hypothetical protein
MKRSLLVGLLVGLLAIVAIVFGVRALADRALEGPSPETIASASLQGLREQNRLSAFAARYVAVVTSTQRRLGVLSAQKTLIMPGMVRYEVDLAKLGDDDVAWDAAARTLTVTLPPIELVGPQVDLEQIKEYDGGGLLLGVTNVGQTLDTANRRAGQAELLKQARSPMPMRLARDAHRRAIERSFALPLRAAGLNATVVARFADEPLNENERERMDRSRSLDEVFAEGTP